MLLHPNVSDDDYFQTPLFGNNGRDRSSVDKFSHALIECVTQKLGSGVL